MQAKRGDVFWVNFDPSIGGEIKKIRPAVIVSNDASNKVLNRLLVIPLTSNVTKLYPSEAYVSVNGVQSKAMADQLATVSKLRLGNHICTLDHEDMRQVERVLKLHLGLKE